MKRDLGRKREKPKPRSILQCGGSPTRVIIEAVKSRMKFISVQIE
jgi:hypothetical protein